MDQLNTEDIPCNGKVPKLISDRWKNRRRMAWLAIFSILLVTYLAFYHLPIEKLKLLDNVITWFYTIMGGIVASYMGLVTFDDIKTRNK